MDDFRLDLQRYVEDGATPIKAVLTQQGLWALLEYRASRAGRAVRPLRPLFVAWQKVVEATTGISIGHGARIGPGLWITHFGGIIVHDDVVVGDGCHICQGVTLGRGFGTGGYGAPVIGDGVYVGPNAVILGRIIVGDRAEIIANSVVTQDVPAEARVRPAPVVVASADVGHGGPES